MLGGRGLNEYMLCHCSSTMLRTIRWKMVYGTKWPLCADVPLSPHSFIYSLINGIKYCT